MGKNANSIRVWCSIVFQVCPYDEIVALACWLRRLSSLPMYCFLSKTAKKSYLKNPTPESHGLSLKVLMVSLFVLFSWFSWGGVRSVSKCSNLCVFVLLLYQFSHAPCMSCWCTTVTIEIRVFALKLHVAWTEAIQFTYNPCVSHFLPGCQASFAACG